MDLWFHCNKCCALGSNGGVFWFTSCGHIICTTCLKNGGMVPGQKGQCIVCQKNDTGVMEINRSMRPDILSMFRPPKDLLAEYSQKIKTTIEFQNAHRQRLVKYYQEKCSKAVKFARNAQSEITKRAERERHLLTERNEVKVELENSKEYIRQLEKVVADRDQEIQRLRRKSPSMSRSKASPHMKKTGRVGPSLNGNTPIDTLSFLGCATSTPNDMMANLAARQQDIPVGTDGQFDNLFCTQRAQEESPLASGPTQFPNTPALLGLSGERRNTNSILKQQYF